MSLGCTEQLISGPAEQEVTLSNGASQHQPQHKRFPSLSLINLTPFFDGKP